MHDITILKHLILATVNLERMEGSFVVKSGLAQMCKGGLIMDVVNAEQAKIAEEAGVS